MTTSTDATPDDLRDKALLADDPDEAARLDLAADQTEQAREDAATPAPKTCGGCGSRLPSACPAMDTATRCYSCADLEMIEAMDGDDPMGGW